MKADIKWIYQSQIGEIEIWAKNKDEAIYTLACHGFTNINPKKLNEAPVFSEDDMRKYDR